MIAFSQFLYLKTAKRQNKTAQLWPWINMPAINKISLASSRRSNSSLCLIHILQFNTKGLRYLALSSTLWQQVSVYASLWQLAELCSDRAGQQITGSAKQKINWFWQLRTGGSQVWGSSQPSDEWRERCPIQEIVLILLLGGEQRETEPGRGIKQCF